MDALSELLATGRGRDAFVLQARMREPWSVRIADRAQLALVAAIDGTVAVDHPDAHLTLGPGDVALVRGTQPYVLAHRTGTAPQVVIEPGQVCRPLDPGDPSAAWAADFGRRVWGNDLDGDVRFLVAVYELPSQFSSGIVGRIPSVITSSTASSAIEALTALILTEVDRRSPGQDAMLDRLVDLLMITVLRAWFDDQDEPGWWRGQQDPLVAGVLDLVHERPDHDWTLAELSRSVGWSRAAVARRFTATVGTAPMTYLTQHRMSLAADLLRTTALPVEAVATRVGYSNAFAFSTAFKRELGLAPRTFRRSTPGYRDGSEPQAAVEPIG